MGTDAFGPAVLFYYTSGENRKLQHFRAASDNLGRKLLLGAWVGKPSRLLRLRALDYAELSCSRSCLLLPKYMTVLRRLGMFLFRQRLFFIADLSLSIFPKSPFMCLFFPPRFFFFFFCGLRTTHGPCLMEVEKEQRAATSESSGKGCLGVSSVSTPACEIHVGGVVKKQHFLEKRQKLPLPCEVTWPQRQTGRLIAGLWWCNATVAQSPQTFTLLFFIIYRDGSLGHSTLFRVTLKKEQGRLSFKFSFCCTFFQESSAEGSGIHSVDYVWGNSGPIKKKKKNSTSWVSLLVWKFPLISFGENCSFPA